MKGFFVYYFYIRESSNGRTPGFGPGDRGSSPCSRAKVKSNTTQSIAFYFCFKYKNTPYIFVYLRKAKAELIIFNIEIKINSEPKTNQKLSWKY